MPIIDANRSFVRLPVFENTLDRGHLILQLGALSHAPLKHARETDALSDRQAHVRAVHRATAVIVQHEEAQRHQHDIQHAENIEPETEGAGRRDEDEPCGRMEILVTIELFREDFACSEGTDRR